jgi:hypothetical protein
MTLSNLFFPQKWRETLPPHFTDASRLSCTTTYTSYQNVDKLRKLDLHEIVNEVNKDTDNVFPSCWKPVSLVWTHYSSFFSRLFDLDRITLTIKWEYAPNG